MTPPTRSSEDRYPVQACYLRGVGSYIPENVYTNDDICDALGFERERGQRYEALLGVKKRSLCVDFNDSGRQVITGEELAYRASLNALDHAGLVATDIDLVISAATFLDYMTPPLSSRLLKRLNLPFATTFDLIGGCAEFLHGVHIAETFIKAGRARNVLIAAAEVIGAYWRQGRFPLEYFIFGDTGGAFILSAERGSHRLIGSRVETQARDGDEDIELMRLPVNGGKVVPELYYPDEGIDEQVEALSDVPASQRVLHNIRQITRLAPKAMVRITKALMADEGISPKGTYLVPHQASIGVMSQLIETEIERERIGFSLPERGNMSNACIPVTLKDHWKDALRQRHLICTSVGVGMSSAAVAFERVEEGL